MKERRKKQEKLIEKYKIKTKYGPFDHFHIVILEVYLLIYLQYYVEV